MKNTLTALTLATVLTFGATIANANGGIIIGSRAEGIIIGSKAEKSACTEKGTYIRVSDSPILSGVMTAIVGIIIGSRPTTDTCEQKDGILVSDRTGILVSD